MTYVIKSRPGCPWCDKARELLETTGEEVVEQKHETELERIAFKQIGFKTFPQIFHNGKHIGGYTELATYLSEDDF